MKVEICFKDFLQRDTNEKKIKTPRKIMASLEEWIGVGIKSEKQAPLV